MGPDAAVNGGASKVNGAVLLPQGASVRGRVTTSNGPVRLQGATAGSIETRRGTIEGLDASLVQGRLPIPRSDSAERGGPVRVLIGRDAQVLGPMEFERGVVLFVYDNAAIGKVSGAVVQGFSGDQA